MAGGATDNGKTGGILGSESAAAEAVTTVKDKRQIISNLLCILFPGYELNEAQGQPAFEKITKAIPCRLDFFVGTCFIFNTL